VLDADRDANQVLCRLSQQTRSSEQDNTARTWVTPLSSRSDSLNCS
jgi:hypothetical protein